MQPFWSIADAGAATYGFSLTAGDLNQDGFVDIVIGSPNTTVRVVSDTGAVTVLSQAGTVQVFLGSANGPSHAPSRTLNGTQGSGAFGNSVQVVGDVNGDGFLDLLVGAFYERSALPVYAGRAYLYLGTEKGLSEYPYQILEGDRSQDRFGASVAAAGDVNNDGFADVVIGAPERAESTEPGATRSGTAYLYLGSKNGLGPALRLADLGEKGSSFGWEVASAGDVNADGYDDIVVRAVQVTRTPRVDDEGNIVVEEGQIIYDTVYEGRVFLYLGAPDGLSKLIFQLNEARETTVSVQWPRRTVGAGYFNERATDKTRFSDFAVGAWQVGEWQEGAVYIYEGRELQFAAPVIASADISHIYERDGNYALIITTEQTGMRASFGTVGVNIQVAPENDAATTDEESSIIIAVSDLLTNDLDSELDDVVSFVGVDTAGLVGTLTDNGDDTFTYSPSGQFEYLAQGESATDSFRYTFTHLSGRTSTARVVITILGVNDAPVLDPVADQTVDEGTQLQFVVTADDPDGTDVLVFTLDGAPGGAGIDPFTGLFRWTPPGWQVPGSYTVTVRVSDDAAPALSNTVTFTIVVNDLGPTAVLTGDTGLIENQIGAFSATGSTSFPDEIASYEWDWEYDGLTFDPSADTGATPSHAWSYYGTYIVAVRVTDEDGSTSVATISVIVAPDAAVDHDEDGVASGDEFGPDGTDRAYDGNGDHLADWMQDNVCSFTTVTGRYITIAASAGQLRNVISLANPAGGELPAWLDAPIGFLAFEVGGLMPGTPVIVTIRLPLGLGTAINAYYKYGQTPDNATPHWYAFTLDAVGGTGAEILGDSVVLHFVDGRRGDDDLTPNGAVVEPGAPVMADVTPPAAPLVTGFSMDTGLTGDGITSDNAPVINGTAEPYSLVAVSIDGVSVGATAADEAGNWMYTAPTLTDGIHAFTATATDAAGNASSASAALMMTVDTTAPVCLRSRPLPKTRVRRATGSQTITA